jgi:peptide/nickel transport system permease protein
MPLLHALLRRRLALAGLCVILLLTLAALLAPWLAPYAPDKQSSEMIAPPSARFWLGTDRLGRDLFSRLLYGAQATLLVGVLANGVAVAIGAFIGVTAGYIRGWVGGALMRFTDLMMAFPTLLLAILLAAMFHSSLWIVAIVIAMVSWVQIARILYAETISLAERDYVVAVRALGASTPRILFRHILPHLVPTIIVWGTLGIATTSLFEATLSYLGVGVQPPTPSWGNMVFESQSFIESAPWLVFFPGLAIGVLALSFNLVGDALRDLLDPTLRGRH